MKNVYGLGIDIGGTKTVISAIDLEGYPIQKRKLNSFDIFQSQKSPAQNLLSSITQYCSENQIQISLLHGIVIGIPGVMDQHTGIITSCPNLTELDGVPLGKLLMEEIQIPVLIENDVNLIAMGEQHRGAGRGVKDLACIIVGTGIGCGLVLEGALYRGADGAAGEFGHMIIQPDGRLCNCGKRGCLEMYCSGKAISFQFQTILGSQADSDLVLSKEVDWRQAEAVIQAAREGHQRATDAIHTAFRYLGLGIVDLANILNPRLILLGGGMLEGWPEGLEIVRKTVQESARVVVKDHLRIEPTILKDEASSAGALLLIQRESNNNTSIN